MVSRPRASFDAGLLMPRSFHAFAHPCGRSKTRTIFSHLAVFRDRSTVPCSPCGAHGRARLPDPPLRMSSAYEARDCASSLKDGHASCSSFDAHCVLAFSVPAHALVLRRSRSHPLSGPAVVRLHAFTQKRPSAFSFCVHDQELLAALTFPCLPCSPFDQHGQHFIGSQSTGSRIRVTFRRELATILFLLKIAPSPRTRQWRPPSSFDHGVRLAVRPLVSCSPCDVHNPRRHTLTRFGPAHLSTSMLETSHRCACVHLSFWTDFRSPRNLAAPALRSTCISRRSRSAGTSVLTFAHVFVVSSHVHAHVQSHLSMPLPFGSGTFEC